MIIFLKNTILNLAGVIQWIECWPVNQRVSGLFLSLSHTWVARPGPQ